METDMITKYSYTVHYSHSLCLPLTLVLLGEEEEPLEQ